MSEKGWWPPVPGLLRVKSGASTGRFVVRWVAESLTSKESCPGDRRGTCDWEI
ncbi:hypothetical protein [Saccharopolyspora sp. 5N708]|uniref:hypothetical protein n=1 Tax=Saccharopolyspora sp. 5N708 TaxID=3457424 RepID=UPI003FD2B47F